MSASVDKKDLPKIFKLEIVNVENPKTYYIDELLPFLTGVEKKKKEKLSDYVKRVGGSEAFVEEPDTDEKRINF